MSSVSLLLAGVLLFLGLHGVLCFEDNDGGAMDMEEEELFGLFEVMGSLLEDPTWAQLHPSPCTDTPWPGVECQLLQETSTFHVTKIHVGPDVATPPCKASAKISDSLLKLPYLKTLSLMNCFTKSQISLSKSLFQSLSSLEHLTLQSNPTLSGEIPPAISNLTTLKILSLTQNNLSGAIPREIGDLVSLQQLDLSHNGLSGPVPEEIGALKNLAILDISCNSLQESLPISIGGLQFLEKIDLSWNRLQGRLPEEMGKLKHLILMDLSHNSLTGPIPQDLSNLQNLQYLIMENNPLNTGFPSFIGSLIKISVLGFSGCGLRGPINISSFSGLTNLTALSLDNNSLNGTVPPELGTLPNLDMLNLSRNQLRGELLFPEDVVNRLGERLDIRENNGLCTNQDIVKTSARFFLQDSSCSNIALFPAVRNKTLADAEQNPDRSRDMKPRLYEGNMSSNGQDLDRKFVLFLDLVFLFLLFGLSSDCSFLQ